MPFLTRAPQPDERVLTSAMVLIDLTRRRLAYAQADMLCERTRWIASGA